MKININYTLESELKSLCFTILLIRTGFFKERKFLLSTKISNKKDIDHISVIIPKEFITLGKVYIRTIGGKFPEKFYLDYNENRQNFDFDKRIVEVIKSKEPEMQEFTNYYNKEFKEKLEITLRVLSDFFPIERYVDTINIYFKSTGTICSYYPITNKVSIIEPRIDASISDILFCLVCSFIQEFYGQNLELNCGQISWEEKQRMAEFIVTRSNLTNITGPYTSINQDLDSNVSFNNPLEVEESNKIYETLGYPCVSHLEKRNDHLFANGSQIENLTIHEERLLKSLIENPGKIITYDKLAEDLWKEESYTKFSIQAIQKTVQRIRRKLDYYGVSNTLLLNKSGKGYMLIE